MFFCFPPQIIFRKLPFCSVGNDLLMIPLKFSINLLYWYLVLYPTKGRSAFRINFGEIRITVKTEQIFSKILELFRDH